MGMCSGSRDLFKFWEITDNISETVQGKNTDNGSPTGKSYVAYQTASVNDLE